MLTGLAVAFAFRCGLFNIGGQGQWIMGAIVSVWVGSSLAGLAGPAHIVLAIVARDAGGGRLGGHRRVPEGHGGRPRGDHDDHAQLDRLLGRQLPLRPGRAAAERRRQSRCRSRTTSSRGAPPRVLGRRRRSRASTSASSSRRRAGRLLAILSRTTLGFRVRAVGRNPEAARYGGISVRAQLLPGDGRSPAPSPAWPAPWTSWAGSSGSAPSTSRLDRRLHRHRRRAARAQHGGRRRLRRAAVRRAPLRHSSRSLDPERLRPELAGNLTTMIQALVLLFIGADVLILYLWHRRGGRAPACRASAGGRRAARGGGGVVAVEHATSRPGAAGARPRPRLGARPHPARGRATGIAAIVLASSRS